MSCPETVSTISLFLPNRDITPTPSETKLVKITEGHIGEDDIAQVDISNVLIKGVHLLNVVLPPRYLYGFENALNINHQYTRLQDFAEENPLEVYNKLGDYCLKLTKQLLAVSVEDGLPQPNPEDDLLEAVVGFAQYTLKPIVKIDPDHNDICTTIWTTLGKQSSERAAQVARFLI